MKIFLNKFLFIIIVVSFFIFNGCDELNNLPINIPSPPIYFSSSGQNNFSSDDGTVCLSGSEEWNDNLDDIESVQFVAASFWSDLGTTAGLIGDITLTLREGSANGPIIFVWSYDNLVAADYQENALEINLSDDQIASMNLYLDTYQNFGDLCFYAILETNNISGQGPPFTINAHVVFVVEAVVKL